MISHAHVDTVAIKYCVHLGDQLYLWRLWCIFWSTYCCHWLIIIHSRNIGGGVCGNSKFGFGLKQYLGWECCRAQPVGVVSYEYSTAVCVCAFCLWRTLAVSYLRAAHRESAQQLWIHVGWLASLLSLQWCAHITCTWVIYFFCLSYGMCGVCRQLCRPIWRGMFSFATIWNFLRTLPLRRRVRTSHTLSEPTCWAR